MPITTVEYVINEDQSVELEKADVQAVYEHFKVLVEDYDGIPPDDFPCWTTLVPERWSDYHYYCAMASTHLANDMELLRPHTEELRRVYVQSATEQVSSKYPLLEYIE